MQDEIVDRVQQRVLDGMGLIVLHSGHFSKIFQRADGHHLLPEAGARSARRSALWYVAPGHPIAEGLATYFEIPHTEMYGEFFDIPQPDELVFISWFAGGEVFRSGCCCHRGRGKVFYFRPATRPSRSTTSRKSGR